MFAIIAAFALDKIEFLFYNSAVCVIFVFWTRLVRLRVAGKSLLVTPYARGLLLL